MQLPFLILPVFFASIASASSTNLECTITLPQSGVTIARFSEPTAIVNQAGKIYRIDTKFTWRGIEYEVYARAESTAASAPNAAPVEVAITLDGITAISENSVTIARKYYYSKVRLTCALTPGQ